MTASGQIMMPPDYAGKRETGPFPLSPLYTVVFAQSFSEALGNLTHHHWALWQYSHSLA